MILIAAMTYDLVIGQDCKIPWNIPKDLKNFKRITMDSNIIMGRRTYESIGKPLTGRHNIVVSRSMERESDWKNFTVVNSIDDAIRMAKARNGKIFIIGGADIYNATINIADALYISWVKKQVSGDTYFPEFRDSWEWSKKEDMGDYVYTEYHRKSLW